MNRFQQLTLASSMTVLLSACGAGAGLPEPEDLSEQISEVVAQVEESLDQNGAAPTEQTEQPGNAENAEPAANPSTGGGIVTKPDNNVNNDAGTGNAANNEANDNTSNGDETPDNQAQENQTPDSQTPDNQTPDSQTPDNQTPDSQTPEATDPVSDQSTETPPVEPATPENNTTEPSNAAYGTWDDSAVYFEGDRVTYNGITYEAGWWNQGSNPAESGQWGVWQPVDGVQDDMAEAPTETADSDNSSPAQGVDPDVTEADNTGPDNSSADNGQAETLPAYGNGPYHGYNKLYQQDSGKAIVSYFVEWSVYGRDYHIADVPARNLTHLLYGFLAICADNPQAGGGAQQAIANECANKQDFEVTLIDKFAALEKTYPGDTWSDDVYGDHYNGNFGQMKKLKAAHPELTILPSVGGWTLSTPFFEMANDDQKRAVFVASVVRFIKQYDFFDGVDIDWEYPGVDGADAGMASAADAQAYTALMRDLRSAFNDLSLETGRQYQITSAIGAGPQHIGAMDYASAHPYMDYIFMMTYDYAGAWSSMTGHHSPLYSNREVNTGYYAQAAVESMLQQGVPSQKLVVGAAMYGRGWNGVSNSNSYAPDLYPLFGEGAGAGRGTWEAGVYDYKDLFENYIGLNNQGINGFSVYYDEVAEAPYLWNVSTGEFISYDSPRSVRAKADFIQQHNLGGFLSWEIDGDNGLILNAINEGLGNTEITVQN